MYQYDPQTKMYVEEGLMKLKPAKKLLTDTGTRFDHINDLLDYLGDGLVAVTNSIARYNNETDVQRKKRLETSIALVEIYRDQLANIDGQQYQFNSLLDSCVPEKGILETIRKEKLERAKDDDSGRKESKN